MRGTEQKRAPRARFRWPDFSRFDPAGAATVLISDARGGCGVARAASAPWAPWPGCGVWRRGGRAAEQQATGILGHDSSPSG